MPTSYDLNFNNIDFAYGTSERKVFDRFSLQIAAGEHCVIIGETGQGKSTLAYLATRCFDPLAGSIFIGDINLKQFSEEQLRQSICYIEQDAHLFHDSLQANLRLAKPDANNEQLKHILGLVGLDQLSDQLEEIAGEFGKRFSGGQIRRIALARALLKKAPITILDEPFEGVDQKTAIEIGSNLAQEFVGKTLIIIAHQPKVIPTQFRRIQLSPIGGLQK